MIDRLDWKVNLKRYLVRIKEIYIAETGLRKSAKGCKVARPFEDYDLSDSTNTQAKSAKFCLSQSRDAANISIKQKRLVPSSLLSLSEDLHLFE